jgi:hypothetical protein
MLISGAGEDEVEAIVEANAEGAYALACGLAGPAVRAGEVVQERRHRADESTCLTRAMAACAGTPSRGFLDHGRTASWHSHGQHEGMGLGWTPPDPPCHGTGGRCLRCCTHGTCA